MSSRPHPKTRPDRLEATIDISDTQRHIAVERTWVERIVLAFMTEHGVSNFELSLVLVDDAAIRVINARHLGHDWSTDVISFADSDPVTATLHGELIISTEMAREQAKLYGTGPLDELALYMVHGLLHVVGFDDHTPEETALMRRHEGNLLRLLGVHHSIPVAAVRSGSDENVEGETLSWPR